MEFLNITKQTSYESVKDEFYTLVENEFEDTLCRSYSNLKDQQILPNHVDKILSNQEPSILKIEGDLKNSFVGEQVSIAP